MNKPKRNPSFEIMSANLSEIKYTKAKKKYYHLFLKKRKKNAYKTLTV